jgi:putative transposase
MPSSAFIESLNGKFRAECLNASWFLSLDEGTVRKLGLVQDLGKDRPAAIGASSEGFSRLYC